MKVTNFSVMPLVLAATVLALSIGRSSASTLEGDDLSEPLRQLYNEIQPGISHIEVNGLLRKYSFGINRWAIHERDLRERTDKWDVSIQHYFENPFAGKELVSYDLYIYFVGTKVGCLFFRHWTAAGSESAQRGSFCYLFGAEQ